MIAVVDYEQTSDRLAEVINLPRNEVREAECRHCALCHFFNDGTDIRWIQGCTKVTSVRDQGLRATSCAYLQWAKNLVSKQQTLTG